MPQGFVVEPASMPMPTASAMTWTIVLAKWMPGVCDGSCTADEDADGICDDVDDCVGEFDVGGLCNGPGAIYSCARK